MSHSTQSIPSVISAEILAPILALFDRGLYLQAYALAQEYGPLSSWRGAAGRVAAGRISQVLGGRRMGRVLQRLAEREHPHDIEAVLYAAYALSSQMGPWEVLNWLDDRAQVLDTGSLGRRAEMLALRARLMATLRDFSAAEKLLNMADSLACGSALVQIERSYICEMNDDYDGALAAAQSAQELRASYRPAIDQHANILRLMNRDDEALSVLSEGASKLESASLYAGLLELQMERELYHDAETSLARIHELSPLSDKANNRWLAGRQADLRYHLGDRAGTAFQSRLAGGDYYVRLAERMENAAITEKRVLLEVDFVRQHHMTCAPATLSAIARYWQQPAEQLTIAEAICYDGSSDQAGRAWAEQAGWQVREFTITWESAVALLDRGIPFTMSTVEAGSAHMQAVIGYDNLRGSFLIRDPFQRRLVEFSAEPALERYSANGPRGMLIVPAERAALLDGMVLPDAVLYDDYYALQSALLRHERAQAIALVAGMTQRAPEHRMTLFARRTLANYDGDEAGRLSVIDELLLRYPQDVNFRLARQSLLNKLGRREQCLDYLRAECDGENNHPLLVLSYAELLRDDARELEHARRLLRRSLRQMPLKAEVYYKLAHVLWDLNRRDEAMGLYRTAVSLEITDERYAESYFKAARYLNQTATALDFLTQRFERWGRKSAQPAMTLFESLDALEQTRKGLEVLEHALELRPSDGELLTYTAEVWALNGDMPRAEELLQRAEPLTRRALWLQSRARLSEGRASLDEALQYWEQLAQDDPFNLRAVRSVARLRGKLQSSNAALAYIQNLVARFPHHHGMNRLRVEWMDDAAAEDMEIALRQVLEINPTDSWSWQKLALNLAGQHHFPEAFAALKQARELAPNNVDYHIAHARLLADSGRDVEARISLRDALHLSVDNDTAIDELLRLCRNIDERRGELVFIHAELVRQVTFGDGLLSFREAARNVLEPQELLFKLREAWQQRPDLWHAWVALARQLRDMAELDEALSIMLAAADRFPLLPLVWVDLAQIERHRANTIAQEAALRQALMISPAWSLPTRNLADLYQGQGRFDDARALLSQALRHNPRDGITHGWLADVLWLLGEREVAIDHLEKALHFKPDYLWAWDRLVKFSNEHHQEHRPLALAKLLTSSQPRNASGWLLLARAHDDLTSALAALTQSLACAPHMLQAHELKVDLLLRAGKFDAAYNATQSDVWHGNLPSSLRLRQARIQSKRGDREEAIAALKLLLENEPDYADAWEQLAIWHDEDNHQKAHLRAAREMVRLNPWDNFAHGYVADALLKNGEQDSGRESLNHALALAPDYLWAINRLFDLDLEEQKLDLAANTLQLLVTRESAANAALARMRLAAASRVRGDVLLAFEALAASGSDDNDLFDRAVNIFKSDGELSELDLVLTRLIEQPESSPQCARLWVDRMLARGQWRFPTRKFAALLQRGSLGLRAASTYLRRVANVKNRRSLQRFMRKNEALLRTDTEVWGVGGYALLSAELNRDCAYWLRDWRVRQDVMPWMLLNLGLALRDLKRDKEANAVSEFALGLNRQDNLAQHRLLLAVDAGMDGNGVRVAQLLEEIGSPVDGEFYKYLHEFVLALRATLQEGDADENFREASWHFCAGVATLPWTTDKFLLRVQIRTLWRIALMRSAFLPLTLVWFVRVYFSVIPYLILRNGK